jgi:hypothetical protein
MFEWITPNHFSHFSSFGGKMWLYWLCRCFLPDVATIPWKLHRWKTMIYESQNQKMVIFNIFVREKNEYVMKQSIQFNVCMHHGLV